MGNLTITRAQYEKMMEPLWKATFNPIKLALLDAHLSIEKIDYIICSGGMTKMPRIQQALKEYFNLEPIKSVNPDEVVALGAAYKAFNFNAKKENSNFPRIVTLSIGVEILGGLFHRVIERNSKLPIKTECIFSTAVNEQVEASINVYQGEREFVEDNKFLDSLKVENLPPYPQGHLKLKIEFKIDEYGSIKLKYVSDRSTSDSECKKKIETQSLMSELETKNHLTLTKKSMLDDVEKKKGQEIMNIANQSIWTVEKLLYEHSKILPKNTKFLAKEIIDILKYHQYEKKFHKIIEQTERLDRIGKQIVEILLKHDFKKVNKKRK